MRNGWLNTLKRFLWWDYPRGSIQYDVMVALILAFIFVTPRAVFHDQPRAKKVVMLPGESGATVFWLEPELLQGAASGQGRAEAVEALIRKQAEGRRFRVLRVEPIFDSEEEVRGYMAFAQPDQ